MLAGGGFIVQVTPGSVILLVESEMVQTLPIDLGSPIGSLQYSHKHRGYVLLGGFVPTYTSRNHLILFLLTNKATGTLVLDFTLVS